VADGCSFLCKFAGSHVGGVAYGGAVFAEVTAFLCTRSHASIWVVCAADVVPSAAVQFLLEALSDCL
jgi:hypothetical protein